MTSTSGYTVPFNVAESYVLRHQTPDLKLFVQERRSLGGYGVWNLNSQNWVWVEND